MHDFAVHPKQNDLNRTGKFQALGSANVHSAQGDTAQSTDELSLFSPSLV